jgi:two-component system, chemotaxis family, sensor kinase CheA
MSDPLQEIRASFFVECEELLEALQDGLAALEGADADPETIHVVFRAVHSIKGGAGAFGLNDLVGFAHAFETVLDEVRADRLDATPDLLRLFFRCADMLSDLVRAARDDTPSDPARVAGVLAELEAITGDAEAGEDDAVEFRPTPLALDLDLGDSPFGIDLLPLPPLEASPTSDWIVSFHPLPELYAKGLEPLFLLRALAELGSAQVECALVPPNGYDGYDPAASLLSWRVTLKTERGEQEIRDVFEFAEGLCELEVSRAAAVAAPTPVPVPVSAPATDPAPVETARPQDRAPEQKRTAPPPSPADSWPSSVGSGEDDIQGGGGSRTSKPGATVRVDLERIERLVNLVGELVINQAMLSQSFSEAGLASDSKIASGLDEFLQLTRDIQDSVMMIRAQPVKSLFQRMGRIVRESSDAVGKSARLVTEGEATEIDKTMIERLSDPLTHMIRNAVDHGLETSDRRRAAGKPPEGTVTLTAGHRSGRVVIEVRDDGAGIDRPRVQALAEERGLIPRGLSLSDAEVDNLLFLPGFSTASQISNLSGRGVGMDVVKNAISSLGGRIGITSAPGAGTTFSISLPLTLAVLDGMIVEAAEETLVVPLGAIIETLTLSDDDLTSVGPSLTAVRVRENFVPLLDLAALLGYAPRKQSYAQAIALLIAQDDGARAALVVDRIVDQRQVVIKGLEDSYGRVPGVAAATILGDGRIALILDPADLMARPGGRAPATFRLAEAG